MRGVGVCVCMCVSVCVYILPRVCSLHMVCVDVDIRYELVENAPGRVHNPIGHLGGHSHRVAEPIQSRCSIPQFTRCMQVCVRT